MTPLTRSIRYFVMLVHVTVSIGYPGGSHLQRNPFVTNTVQDVHVKSKKYSAIS